MSVLFKPFCHLEETSNLNYQLNVRVQLPAGKTLGSPTSSQTSTEIVFQIPTQSDGSTSDHWEGLIGDSLLSFSLTSAPTDCSSHKVEVEIYDGAVSGNPKGKIIIRTIDADDDG